MPEAPGVSIRQVLDPWHEGEWCQVDTLTLSYWNPRYLGKLSFFSDRRELDTLRLPLRSFAQEVARALSLPARHVAVLDEPGGLASLNDERGIFLSLAPHVGVMKEHLFRLRSIPGRLLLLTLLDEFADSSLPPASSLTPSSPLPPASPLTPLASLSPPDGRVMLRPLHHFIDDEHRQDARLHPWEGENFSAVCDRLHPGVPSGGSRQALCRRPKGASFRELTLILHTSDREPSHLPEDDELELGYGKQKRVRKPARELSVFVTRQGTFNVYWQLLRLHALGHGTLTEPLARKRHVYAERRRVLRRLLNILVDMPPGAEAFHRGAEKYSVTGSMNMEVCYHSPSVRLSPYNTRTLGSSES